MNFNHNKELISCNTQRTDKSAPMASVSFNALLYALYVIVAQVYKIDLLFVVFWPSPQRYIG